MLHPKRKLLSLGSLALTGCILAGMLPNTHAAPEPDTLTIASYNIAGNMAIPSQLLAQDMTSHGVDIAGLQEVDKLTSRNNHDVPVEIAQEMGEEYSSFFGKSIDFGGGEYGNAIVSRYEFQDTDHALFPDNGYEGRSWSKVVVEVDGKSIAFYNTHLAYETTEARLAQIEELIQIVDADPTPYKVITGDFNTDQSTTEFYSFLYNYNLANGHNNEWIDTYAGYDPNMKTNAIDNIITTRNMRLVEVDTYRREEGKTSDHRMLYATYELLDEEVPSTQLLDIRIQEAQDLLTQSDAYTPETVTALREALDQALQGTKETQEQINALVRPLEQAIDGLEEMVEPAVPVAYYSFDDGSTRDLIADSHGEDQGNPAYVDSFSAQAGKALDTTNGYVSIEKVNDAFRWGTGDASIAFWFKASDLDYSWMIGDKDWSSGANPGFGVCCYKSYNNANRFYSSFADNSRNRTEQQTTNTLDYINDGQWHHIAATLDRDGDSLLYVDGQQVASATTNPASTGDATSSLPFCIGADSKGNYRTKAQYDEVKVYHEALTPEQVALAAELPHTHQATQVEEKAATCTQDGNIAYWYCADCGKYFSDEACTVEITLEDTVVAATGHHYENGVCVDCGEKEPDHGQANKTLLQKTYEYALTLSTEGVTDSAKAAFETALANAKTVLDNANATQDEVNAAWHLGPGPHPGRQEHAGAADRHCREHDSRPR